MKKVLLSQAINPAGMKILEGKVEPAILTDSTVETTRKMVADVEGIILRTNIKVLDQAFKEADFISIHIPYIEQTYNTVGCNET